jgi:membrane protein
MSIKAVFFDIDGTLVDSNELHVTAWERAFRERSHPVDRGEIRREIGKGADMLLPALAPKLSEGDRKAIADLHGRIFQTAYLPQVRPFPYARDLIAALDARGTKVLLASSADQFEVDHYIELLDVRQFVAGTTSGDDVNETKPAADIFVVTLAKVAPMTASEVIAIGDTPYDAAAAGKAGIETVAVRSGGFSDSSLRDAGARAIYDSVAELLKYLEEPSTADRWPFQR